MDRISNHVDSKSANCDAQKVRAFVLGQNGEDKPNDEGYNSEKLPLVCYSNFGTVLLNLTISNIREFLVESSLHTNFIVS